MLKTFGLLIALGGVSIASTMPATASLYPSYIRKHYPKSIQPLLLRENALDEQCRGASGDLPSTQRACRQRDAVTERLKAKGWCWGSKDPYAPEAKMTWLLCRDDRSRG
ncbi:hypothetical protein [Sphingomonas sp. TX0522]|uniref:hypothetical protein n=1 Tax=Sphingomonas sp. TX0522 TaxID=2479205 RepID=UPI0018DFDC39|nr:hypothetical protein [Sphingomonas sp. TX0522]MBI0530361.1 hypothetical protein [Sphingomonas sp. TX0522]